MNTLVAVTVHGIDLRSVAESVFPLTDFDAYLRFVDECRGKKTYQRKTHIHHILPVKQFPEYADEPWNQILLTVAQHVHAHDLLSMANPEFYVPPSLIEASMRAATLGGKCSARICKAEGRGHFAPGEARRSGLRNAEINKPLRRGIFDPAVCRQGGKTQGLRNKREGRGYCGLTLEERRTAGRKGIVISNHHRWHVKRNLRSLSCPLCSSHQ
jgi:hypothetical protein